MARAQLLLTKSGVTGKGDSDDRETPSEGNIFYDTPEIASENVSTGIDQVKNSSDGEEYFSGDEPADEPVDEPVDETMDEPMDVDCYVQCLMSLLLQVSPEMDPTSGCAFGLAFRRAGRADLVHVAATIDSTIGQATPQLENSGLDNWSSFWTCR